MGHGLDMHARRFKVLSLTVGDECAWVTVLICMLADLRFSLSLALRFSRSLTLSLSLSLSLALALSGPRSRTHTGRVG